MIELGSTDIANALVLQPDGKIVLAGGTSGIFAVTRLNPDGSLDTGFGGGDGVITIGFNSVLGASAVALQPDGRIVVAGNAGTSIAVARLLPNGEFDATFDGDGRRLIEVGGGWPGRRRRPTTSTSPSPASRATHPCPAPPAPPAARAGPRPRAARRCARHAGDDRRHRPRRCPARDPGAAT